MKKFEYTVKDANGIHARPAGLLVKAAKALEEAGATGEALNNAIANMEFTGLTGSFGFDDAHTPTKKVLVVQLEDGVQVNPVEVDPNS